VTGAPPGAPTATPGRGPTAAAEPARPTVPIRVLWLIKGLGPGGAEQLLVNLARARDRERFAYSAAFLVPWKDHLVADLVDLGVPVTCLDGEREPDLRWARRLRQRLVDDPVDVLHVHSPYPAAVARALVRTLPRAVRPQVVTTEHNVWARYGRLTWLANRWTFGLSDHAVVVSEAVRDSMPDGPRQRAEVVVHGIDVAAVRAHLDERDAVRAELGAAPDDVLIGTVANFRRQKAYPDMLAAARLAIDAGAPVRFAAVGQGPLEAEIRTRHAELDLGDRFQLLGYRPDAARVLAGCDVFTLSSIHEGLPVALMEALALGLPVAATTVGGIPEAVTNGVEGILVPPGHPDRLARAYGELAADPALRADMATAAAARGRHFGVEAAATRLEAIYLELATAARAAESAAATPAPADTKSKRAKANGASAAHARTTTGRAAGPEAPPLRVERGTDEHDDAVLPLLAASLGWGADERYRAFFEWKHRRNPFGVSPTWVALDEGRVVGFRTLLRWEFTRGDEVVAAVRAVDTATDPAYQGRGIFRRLTLQAVDELRDEGVAFVFNTPNDQSRPGYLTMGWEVVGRPEPMMRPLSWRAPVRLLTARVPASRWSEPTDAGEAAARVVADLDDLDDLLARATPEHGDRLRTHRTPAYLAWRYGSDVLPYRAVGDADGLAFFRLRRRGPAVEAVLGDVLVPAGDRRRSRALVSEVCRVARRAGADYALCLGDGSRVAHGFVALPGQGPILTWRGLTAVGRPPLSGFALALGDIELF
jgi:L-malate glycosyltransferase